MTRPLLSSRRVVAAAALAVSAAVSALVPAGAPATGATRPREAPAGQLRVAHANLQFKMSSASYAADLATVVSGRPDLVSLNEVSRRTEAELSPAGYDHFMPRQQGNGDAVLWRRDRWSQVDGGVVTLTDGGPRKYDKWRLATWAVLDSTTGTGTVTMISTHMMENPATIGPDKPLRQRIYAEGMRRLASLVGSLATRGPVFVAGDLNSQFRKNDPWGPRRALATVGLRSAMEKMGSAPTHDAGGIIDYVFYPAAQATPSAQRITNLRSDHKLLVDDFVLAGPAAARTRH